jgi:L,D-transpeptidase ErfK/SrfK
MMAFERSVDRMRYWRRLDFGKTFVGAFGVLFLFVLPAVAAEFPVAATQTAVGAVEIVEIQATQEPDTLMDVSRRYDLGFTQLMAANRGVNPWTPGNGRQITVPNYYLLPDAPRSGIVINLAEQRLYYFPPGKKVVETFPLGIGVQGASTPIGTTRIVAKQANPAWFPPPSIHEERPELPQVIAAGPDNPLGAYAFRLGWPNFLIHGTNKPDGVGRNVSHGCMHLYPEDIARLFREIPIGTVVRVLDEEVKTAWIDNELFVEVHPTKEQGDELDIDYTLTPTAPPVDLESRVNEAAGERADRIDWAIVRQVGVERTGIPTQVTVSRTVDQWSAESAQATLVPSGQDLDVAATTSQ